MQPYSLIIKQFALSIAIFVTSSVSVADVITFHFTGQFTAVDQVGKVIPDQSPIESIFTYDTSIGTGSAELFIAPFTFFGLDITLSDISIQRIEDTNFVLGNMLAEYRNGTGVDEAGVPVSMIWDATGMFNAINYGLQAGDVISGTNLLRDGNLVYDVNSANPASNGYLDYSGTSLDQGPAPLAMTTFNTSTLCSLGGPGNILYTRTCLDLAVSGGADYTDDGIAGSPLIGGVYKNISVNLDIGSGNSLTVLSISAVPIPSSVWLLGSGLVGLIGFARRKKA